jgi:hypothetical protein
MNRALLTIELQVSGLGLTTHADNSLVCQSGSFGAASCAARELEVAYIVIGKSLIAFVDLIIRQKCPFVLQSLVAGEVSCKSSEYDDFQAWMSTCGYICQQLPVIVTSYPRCCKKNLAFCPCQQPLPISEYTSPVNSRA